MEQGAEELRNVRGNSSGTSLEGEEAIAGEVEVSELRQLLEGCGQSIDASVVVAQAITREVQGCKP